MLLEAVKNMFKSSIHFITFQFLVEGNELVMIDHVIPSGEFNRVPLFPTATNNLNALDQHRSFIILFTDATVTNDHEVPPLVLLENSGFNTNELLCIKTNVPNVPNSGANARLLHSELG